MNPSNKERCRHNISKVLTSDLETAGTKQSSTNVINVINVSLYVHVLLVNNKIFTNTHTSNWAFVNISKWDIYTYTVTENTIYFNPWRKAESTRYNISVEIKVSEFTFTS